MRNPRGRGGKVRTGKWCGKTSRRENMALPPENFCERPYVSC